MRELDLVEHRLAEAVPLSPAERDVLVRLVPSLGVRPTVGAEGTYDLRPGSHVGAVRCETLSVQIRPKIPVARVLFLISYALDTRWTPMADHGFEEETSLVEAIVPAFVDMVRRATRRGLLHGYRVEEDALTTVRGRLRFDAQVRDRFGIMPPAEVRYDEYTEDVEVNRRLKAAAVRLGRLGIRTKRGRDGLRSLRGVFSRVSLVEHGRAALPTIQFDRLNAHYEPAVRLADLVLRGTSLELRRGAVRASSFLVDMNAVFETFVIVALREALGLSERAFPQGARSHRLRLDQGERVGLYPDISWWEGGRCRFVGDAKYKRTYDGSVPNADLYQLLAYATAADLPGGLLVYAEGEGEPAVHLVRHAGKRLEVRTLALGGPPESILEQIRVLAERIRAMHA